MDKIKDALAGQYRAGLAMLREEIEKCPEDVWVAGKHPRNFWRIAYHALFFTHFYLMQKEADFVPWEKHRDGATDLWEDADPPVIDPYTRQELLEYLETIFESVPQWVERLDLTTDDPGFHWYKIPKMDHQVLNVRHLGGHVGQLSELLMAHGIDVNWASKK
ncbi:MAG TPA: hypothetical protein VNI20_05715 [Fimbriimonadaceae bacterium]|nr:hypothetical protein [Fimbriimonadaceae bacterium]